MKWLRIALVIAVTSPLAACVSPAVAPAENTTYVKPVAPDDSTLSAAQAEVFGPLAAMVGKKWRGEPLGESSEQEPDYQSWEWALDGAALLIRHALADGSYGGDTYVYRNAKDEGLTYVYTTTAGFITQGAFTFGDDGSWTAEEVVEGHPEITRVRSTVIPGEDGSLAMSGSYLRNGAWEPGHGFIYRETDEAMPVLNAIKALSDK